MRLLVTLLVDIVIGAFWLFRGLVRTVLRPRKPHYVAFELTGDLPARFAGAAVRRFVSRGSALRVDSVRTFGERLDAVAKDPRVAGVVVKIEGLTASMARLVALRDHLLRFRAGGKRTVAYVRAVDGREYLVAAAAETLYVAPGGRVDLTGFAAEASAAGTALRRLGVRPQFHRRGEHKTAPELFTHDTVSPATREALSSLLGEMHAVLVREVAKGRGLDESAVREAIDRGPYTAAGAVKAKLADGVADGEEIEALLAPKGEEKARLGTFAELRASVAFPPPPFLRLRRGALVAVVPVRGVIKAGDSARIPFGPRLAGSDSIARALRVARESKAIKAVVLDVDSRGGSVLGSELASRAVARCAAEKPVVAYVDRVAASGGYMVASRATQIVSSPTAIVGSIGVFGGKFDFSGLLERLGVASTAVAAGEHAGMLSPSRPMSAGESAAFDAEIDEAYRDFLSIVEQGRRLTPEKVRVSAEGRVFSGRAAMERGLVDETGSFDTAVARACDLAKIAGEPSLRVLEFAQRALSPFAALRPLASEAVWALMPDLVRMEPGGRWL